ncbi:MFS transporter [SAR202 cluster bacterium AD-804-J14_MRT_500m]|nr:MFS transporter [SAR202 cluster bacterium AD-804-J14_MRT_500m]
MKSLRRIKRWKLPRLQVADAWDQYPNYRLLWASNFCAHGAMWLQLLTVGWLVQDMTGGSGSNSLHVVTVGGLSVLPVLLVGPWGGVLGDRVDRRKLVMGTYVLMGIGAALFSALVFLDIAVLWHAYIYVLYQGSLTWVSFNIRMALIANTVTTEYIPNAFATVVITVPGTRLVMPFFGGLLIAHFGFTSNFIIETVLYAIALVAMIPMKTNFGNTVTPHTEGSVLKSAWQDIYEGFQYMWRDERMIFTLILLTLIPNVIIHPVLFILPVFTSEVLGMGADVGGYLLAATGLGGVIGALVLASLGFGFKKGPLCLFSVLTASALVMAFAYSQWLVVAIIVIGVFSFSQTVFRTVSGALIQLLTPDHLRGRITSLHSSVNGYVVASGILLGYLATIVDVKLAIFTIGGIGVFCLVCLSIMSPSLRKLS